MNEKGYKKYFNPQKLNSLITELVYFDIMRIEALYRDTIQTIKRYDEKIKKDNKKNIDPVELKINYIKKGKQSEAIEIEEYTSTLLFYLKTMYIFADIFINTLLKEVYNIPDDVYMSYYKFINEYVKTRNIDFKISEELKLKLYCICIYRNKIIAHHDVLRSTGFSSSIAGEIRLLSFPKNSSPSEADIKKIEELKKKYENQIPSLKNTSDFYNLLEILYYNVPLYDKNGINTDRRDKVGGLDGIIERNGCPSYTIDEIMEIINQSILEIIGNIAIEKNQKIND